ncbi:potassium-transporting ATPase subunit KdpC [bacterium]|nr:potassium-transporting ATPase subunit KdpC [bacterium]
MTEHIRPAFVLLLLFTLLTGLAYPLALTGVDRVLFPQAAIGSPVVQKGVIVGSALVGQAFADPKYFHPRPSASGYDGLASGGSNLGPLSARLIERVKGDVAALGGPGPVPADAVTASASGLDPDISPDNARAQVARVSVARNLPQDQVRALVERQVHGRIFGFLGEAHVNVLELNLALDRLAAM